MACAVETRYGRFRVRHPSLLPAVLECVRTLDRVSTSQACIERRDCGTGAGGFKPGNKCAGGGDGSGGDSGGGSEGGGGDSGGGSFMGSIETHSSVSEEHIARARQLTQGIKNSYARSLAEEAYAQHIANGGTPPEIVTHTFKGYKATAMYSQSNDKIFVNASVNSKSEQAFQKSVQSGFLSQPNPVLHELGHKAHADALGSSYDSAKNHAFSSGQKKTIETQVSRYAATNGLEFAAEVYAGVSAGREYSDEVLQMFSAVTRGKVTLRRPLK